jgi:uncharacterized membrane protein YdjX (TVP38/TMEM64 family)
MPKVSRAICWQVGALIGAFVMAIVLSRFLPIISFIETSQQRVMNWGAWGAVCYPLLFAACNILLLPGGILAVGGGFFFGLWWGFFIVLVGNLIATASTFPNELAELFLRDYANPIWHLHALGFDRKGAWSFFVRLRGNPGSVCSADYAGQKLSSHD